MSQYIQKVKFTPKSSASREERERQTTTVDIRIDGPIEEFDADRQSRFVRRIAEQTRSEVESIRIRGIAAGSVLVTLEMPAEAAARLIQLCLQGSQFTEELRIINIGIRSSIGQQQEHLLQLPPPSIHRVKVVFLAANPRDEESLRLGKEHRAIEEALQSGKFRDKFVVTPCMATRPSDLLHYLLEYKPNVVHFSGHGTSSGAIILEDNAGMSNIVSPRALISMFSALRGDIKCVVLNACYTQKQANAIANLIDCVIGISGPITDNTSISFAQAFYKAVAFGENLQTAFELGRANIDLNKLGTRGAPKILAKRINPSTMFLLS